MMMLSSHPGNKEALLGVPGLLPTPHPLPAGLQMRNINQHFLCLKSLPVTLSLKTFPDHIRSSQFPAKHLKGPPSGDVQSQISTYPSFT